MPLEQFAKLLKQLGKSEQPTPESKEQLVRRATAGILLEIAHADADLSVAEEERLKGHLISSFQLTPGEADELLAAADRLRTEQIDHWSLTNIIRKHCSLEERIEIVRSMWRIVYADGYLHQYENYLVRKLADLLGLEHHVMIESKLAVQNERAAATVVSDSPNH